MKALKSPFAQSILRNPANAGAVRLMYTAGYGPENGVQVTVTPADKDSKPQQPIEVVAYAVPAARPN